VVSVLVLVLLLEQLVDLHLQVRMGVLTVVVSIMHHQLTMGHLRIGSKPLLAHANISFLLGEKIIKTQEEIFITF
jgi:hypothetical protein